MKIVGRIKEGPHSGGIPNGYTFELDFDIEALVAALMPKVKDGPNSAGIPIMEHWRKQMRDAGWTPEGIAIIEEEAAAEARSGPEDLLRYLLRKEGYSPAAIVQILSTPKNLGPRIDGAGLHMR